MRNKENLFNNIRYSQELAIEEVVRIIEPYIDNKVSITDISKRLGIGKSETNSALKALNIAEVIVSTTKNGKRTNVIVTDVKTFNLIRKRFGLPVFEEGEGA